MQLKSIYGEYNANRLWNLGSKERKERLDKVANNQDKIDGPIIITAQLSRKSYNLLQSSQAEIEVPSGVSMKNEAGSRILEFSCEDEYSAEELVNGLETSGIPWQEEDASEDVNLSDIIN